MPGTQHSCLSSHQRLLSPETVTGVCYCCLPFQQNLNHFDPWKYVQKHVLTKKAKSFVRSDSTDVTTCEDVDRAQRGRWGDKGPLTLSDAVTNLSSSPLAQLQHRRRSLCARHVGSRKPETRQHVCDGGCEDQMRRHPLFAEASSLPLHLPHSWRLPHFTSTRLLPPFNRLSSLSSPTVMGGISSLLQAPVSLRT
ncbi:uncharacterized protein LOC118898168 [Balaenoptera musculus]|uniref:Uncharacterized protein LOC118898168 n=1 Tax=Balaenoptera musculus TaxID=9771 RepID=A0A8B8XX41_BALMU|nr:uncharacterized protein LOC118898168 [Balaenoptera musculus]